MAWAAGEIPLVVVMIALLVQWSRSDQRTARRLDRAADRDDDAELAAYNAMLAEMARRGNRVLVYASERGYENPAIRYAKRETLQGVEIRRFGLASFGKKKPAKMPAPAE